MIISKGRAEKIIQLNIPPNLVKACENLKILWPRFQDLPDVVQKSI
jgi:hypothetical protein